LKKFIKWFWFNFFWCGNKLSKLPRKL